MTRALCGFWRVDLDGGVSLSGGLSALSSEGQSLCKSARRNVTFLYSTRPCALVNRRLPVKSRSLVKSK